MGDYTQANTPLLTKEADASSKIHKENKMYTFKGVPHC